ncbi:MAG: hypothetical protein A2010_04325 [Nitrospirae bacterium GWD2_57_9]|nr:MAG: hypothetical protein A2010_04325 [Nitrospirae bacterium GWD2_57_9]
MQKDAKHDEPHLSAEIQDVMKNLISAIRIVKIYPPNNPIYSQSIKKAFEGLAHFLSVDAEYHAGVQKTYFTFYHTPVAKDAQVNRSIAQDLFAKGIREIVFSPELAESELQELCRTLALSTEELAMKNGISSILWEKGVTHIKVTESGLDEVIAADAEEGGRAGDNKTPAEGVDAAANKQFASSGKTLLLGDVKTDPGGFGARMLEYAKRTRAEDESVEDRLFTLYQQAGKKIQKDHAQESEELFRGLARSVLSLEPQHRDSLVVGKLYGELDADEAGGAEADQQLPTRLHELRTGRFSKAWSIEHVASLLKRSASKKNAAAAPQPGAAGLQVVPLNRDLVEIARDLKNDTPEEAEALHAISSAGMESDIIEAAVRTLISLIPLVRHPLSGDAKEKDLNLFSGVIHQLEDILSYLLMRNNYHLATTIINALHMPVDQEFKPRMQEALRKTATKPIIKSTITDMRRHVKSSAEYQAAYSYLSSLDQKATEALLELLAEEKDREARIFLLDLMKDFGKNQIALLGEHLDDDRWYVVRNIVSILAENRSDQAIALLRKAADHKNVQIRQEVIKALMAAGGKKAASVLGRFVRDEDPGIQLMAVRGFTEMQGAGPEEVKPLIELLQERRSTKKEQELTLEAIKVLGKVGGPEAALFLQVFTRIRWWKPRKLQLERRDAAQRSIEEIARRQVDGGRAGR